MLVSFDEWDEWNAITETLHIASQPGLMAHIHESEQVSRNDTKTLDEIL
jgi:PHD/YefM family antitoxin component YafN of YafNO toxin-antitoxin module